MTNPYFGFDELPSSLPAQPEVPLNEADLILSAALVGEIEIDFESDADYELQASDPVDAQNDEWFYHVIRMTDSGTVLTATRDVVFPNLDEFLTGASRPEFIFVNETAQDLVVRGDNSSAVGVTVEAGDAAKLWYDGSDVVAVVNPLP